MNIMRRHYILLGSRIMIPAVILGLLVFPNLVNCALQQSVRVMPKQGKCYYLTNESFNSTVEVYPNEYTKVRIPPEKVEKIGVLEVVFKLPKKMRISVNVSRLREFIGPRPPENYHILYYFMIVFKDVSTGKTVEPTGYVIFEVPKIWIEKGKYDPSRVVLLKLIEQRWVVFKTELLKEDAKNYYYKTELPSFSIFAVAVNVTTTENCTECHRDVAVELSMSPYHNFNCTFCHPGMSRNVTCVRCHPLIGNFSAHKKFIEWAENNTLMKGSNEACIACHTYAKIPILNVTERRYMSFEFDMGELHE